MAEINWTVLTYIVVGIFALNGFFRGWWKEAITAAFLTFLVFLLQQPGIAEAVIEIVNRILDAIWLLIPNSLLPTVDTLFEDIFAVSTNGQPLEIDPGSPQTWLLVLLILLGLATLLGRSTLHAAVTPMGSILGGLVGAFNGFVAVSLVREYLRGTNLPDGSLPTEIAGGNIASSGVGFQAVNVPNISILDSFLPWIIIGVGVLLLLVALNNRIGLSKTDGFRRIDQRTPLGHR